jgi:hypothetical protein
VRVAADYDAAYPDPLLLAPGEMVQVGRADEQWPEFVWCVDAGGQGGWVPASFLHSQGGTAVVLRPYTARELSVRAGEAVTLAEWVGGWAWATNAGGESGWVPESCLDLGEDWGELAIRPSPGMGPACPA